MGYCTEDDVKKLLKGMTISDTSKITTADLTEWIDDFSKTMDGKLVKKYTVPVTDAEGVEILRIICKKFVAAHFLEITYLGSNKGQIPEQAKDWKKDAGDSMRDIMARKVSVTVESDSGISHTGENDSNGVLREPKMTKDMVF